MSKGQINVAVKPFPPLPDGKVPCWKQGFRSHVCTQYAYLNLMRHIPPNIINAPYEQQFKQYTLLDHLKSNIYNEILTRYGVQKSTGLSYKELNIPHGTSKKEVEPGLNQVVNNLAANAPNSDIKDWFKKHKNYFIPFFNQKVSHQNKLNENELTLVTKNMFQQISIKMFSLIQDIQVNERIYMIFTIPGHAIAVMLECNNRSKTKWIVYWCDPWYVDKETTTSEYYVNLFANVFKSWMNTIYYTPRSLTPTKEYDLDSKGFYKEYNKDQKFRQNLNTILFSCFPTYIPQGRPVQDLISLNVFGHYKIINDRTTPPKSEKKIIIFGNEDYYKESFFTILNYPGGEIFSFCVLREFYKVEWMNILYIHNLCVNPKYRGKGICGLMLNQIKKRHPKMVLILNVRTEQQNPNFSAVRCYIKSGFEMTSKNLQLQDGMNTMMVYFPGSNLAQEKIQNSFIENDLYKLLERRN